MIELQYLEKRALFNGRFNSLRDIRESEVVLTKDDLRRHYPLGLCFVEPDQIWQYHESFGTTGTPTASPMTKADFDHYVSQILLSPVNFDPRDRVLIRFPYALSAPAHIFHHAAQRNGAMVIPASNRSHIMPYPRVVKLLHALQATVLCLLPTEAIIVGHFAKEAGLELPTLRAVCTAGELLTPQMQNYLETLWKAPVYNFYGATEVGNMAYSCKNGRLHVADPFFDIQIVGANPGNIVVTTRKKEALPLLRYDTEDMGYLPNTTCECGNPSPVIELFGRKQDRYAVDGKTIYHRDLKDVLFGLVNFLGLSPFWKCQQHGHSLVVTIEESADLSFARETLTKNFNIPIEIRSVPKDSLSGLKGLHEFLDVKKPEYFLKEEEQKKC